LTLATAADRLAGAVKAAVVTLALLVATPARAWGPYTHQWLGCGVLETSGTRCFDSVGRRSLLRGSVAPDALKLYLPGGARLHRWDFAGHLHRFARERFRDGAADLDAVAFADGFGAHLAEDAVGHRNPDGYLTPRWNRQLEAAVDTWIVRTWGGQGFDYQSYAPVKRQVATLLADAIADWQRTTGNAIRPPVTRAALEAALDQFDALAVGEVGLLTLNAAYRTQMTRYDRHGARTFKEAEAHLTRARTCAITAARAWQTAIRQPNATPARAEATTQAAVRSAFTTGPCKPN
jgi:hypothetical protein